MNFSHSDTNKLLKRINWDKVDGLIPAIIQDFHSSQVLMLGYMNEKAIKKTIEINQVTFFSRTKNCLWTKGETSRNTLELVNIALDCDNDSLLIQVNPQGPTCHNGTETCWDKESQEKSCMSWLYLLEAQLKEKKNISSKSSYTAYLFEQGVKRIAQKVGEEGVEVALAATVGDENELVAESADLIYHLLVLLQYKHLSIIDVIAVLKTRNK